ncbi:hypothetical protein [Streptomyces sp. NPDC046925]|uniref:hypothetical protein n=1 Tax=Streptomyces sp. NPDC046925 TaxID=3155375 RepID=UPI0033D0A390
MPASLTTLPVCALTLLVVILSAILLALLAAISTGFLARWDGASLPGALLHASAAFGATLTLLCSLIALGIATLT